MWIDVKESQQKMPFVDSAKFSFCSHSLRTIPLSQLRYQTSSLNWLLLKDLHAFQTAASWTAPTHLTKVTIKFYSTQKSQLNETAVLLRACVIFCINAISLTFPIIQLPSSRKFRQKHTKAFVWRNVEEGERDGTSVPEYINHTIKHSLLSLELTINNSIEKVPHRIFWLKVAHELHLAGMAHYNFTRDEPVTSIQCSYKSYNDDKWVPKEWRKRIFGPVALYKTKRCCGRQSIVSFTYIGNKKAIDHHAGAYYALLMDMMIRSPSSFFPVDSFKFIFICLYLLERVHSDWGGGFDAIRSTGGN